jgi:folate-binding protein YgfZ
MPNMKLNVPLDDRAIIAISGEDARKFLQGLITNDIEKVSPTRSIYAALLTPQGKFLHDFFITEYKERLLLDCEAERVPDLIKRLTMYRLRAKVDITNESEQWDVGVMLPMSDVAGLGSKETEPGGAEAGTTKTRFDGVSYIDPRNAALGERIIRKVDEDDNFSTDETLLEKNRAAYHARRLVLGIPDSTADLIPEKSMPMEAGFDLLNGIDFEKGCYVGQEVTARMKHRDLVKKRLFPVTFDGEVAAGTDINCDGVTAGELHSVQGNRGLALLRLDLVEKGGLTANGVSVWVES